MTAHVPMSGDPRPVETFDLTKEFRSRRRDDRILAVDGLSFRVERGEILALLGPNGSGKSTTMKLLLGLLSPTAGAARLFGRRAGDRRALGRVGYLPEETRLYPFLTARETVRFFARLAARPAAREAADSRIEEVGLTEVAHRRVKGFSKGMARRLGLAAALVGDPDLLVLDEPTSGLDPLAAADMKDRIRAFSASGRSVLLSSHLLSDVEAVCDRVVVLGRGRIVAEGRPEGLLTLRDEFELRFTGGGEGLAKRVEEIVRSAGGEITFTGHPREDLEALFLRLFREQ